VVGGLVYADWTDSDVPIGLVPAGSALESPPGTWTIQGGGDDIAAEQDGFYYLYEDMPLGGTFAVGCRVVSLEGTSGWAKAGIMARMGIPDFIGDEYFAFGSVSRAHGTRFQWRDDANNQAAQMMGLYTQGSAGTELKLVRSGRTIEAYASPTTPPLWRLIGQRTFADTVLPNEDDGVYVGLAVTAHNSDVDPDELATAVFDSVNLTDPGFSLNQPANFRAVRAPDGVTVQLSWTNTGAYSQLGLFRQDPNGALTPIAGVTPGSQSATDTPGDGTWTYWLGAVDTAGLPALAVAAGVQIGATGFLHENGVLRSWLLLGPLSKPGGSVPASDLRLADYFTNGQDVTQENALPVAYDEVTIDFSVAQSTDVQMPAHFNPDGANGTAVWYPYTAPEAINHTTFYLTDPNNHMVNHITYITNETGTAMFLAGAASSDDSIVVMLDNTVFWNHGIGRGMGGMGNCPDRFPFALPPGEHRLLVKVFDGTGGSGFRLRFEDPETGDPVTTGFSIATEPQTMASVPAGPTATVRRGLPGAFFLNEEATITLDVAGGPVDIYEVVPSNMTIGRVLDGGQQAGTFAGEELITWKGVTTAVSYTVTPTDIGGTFMGIGQESPPTGLWLCVGGSAAGSFAEHAGDWVTDDIADSGQAGSVVVTQTQPSPPTYDMSITGSGHDIWGKADDFRFVWQERPATASIVVQARLDSFPRNNNDWAKAGVMFRTYATQGSPYVYAMVRAGEIPDGGVDPTPDLAYQWRDEVSADAAHDTAFYGANTDIVLPYWIRGVYENGEVTGFFAPDVGGEPGTWIQTEAHTLNLDGSSTVLAGLAVTSHDDGQVVTAEFSEVTIDGGAGPDTVHVLLGELNGDGRLNVADAVYLLMYIFRSGDEPGCLKAADVNDDDRVNVADPVMLLGYIFLQKTMIAPDGVQFSSGGNPGCAPYPRAEVEAVAGGCKVQCVP
jgi:hypothetical protein